LDVLKGWDTERNAEVKAQASLQYHSLLKADEVERTDAVKVLDSMLPCYGPDHEERRQAAAAGLIVLKHLDLVVGKVESIGHVGRQVNIPVTDGLKKNRVFLNLLGTHWGYVKQVLAGKFEILTQNVGPSELWQNLAIVAAEHPSLATDVLEAGETDLGLRGSANFLTLVGRLEPRSERLAQLCLAAIADNGPRDDLFDSNEAAAVLLADQFRGDPRIEERLVGLGSRWHFPLVGAITNCSKSWNLALQGLELWMLANSMQNTRVFQPQCYQQRSKQICFAQRNPFFVNNVIRPLVARLRDDPEAVGHVCNTLFTSANPTIKASFSKILAFSGSFTVERDKWSQEEIGRQISL